MSQLVMLILPASATLDSIRRCLADRFALNPKVEGLGDAEELQATDESGRTTVFEALPGPPSEELRRRMQQRSLVAEDFRYFWARYGWATSEAALLHAAESLRGWLYDAWSRLLSPAEFREVVAAANGPVT